QIANGVDSYLGQVIDVESSDVTLDGLVFDADNPALDSLPAGDEINGADPDVAVGVFAYGDHITVQNSIFRNGIYAGFWGYASYNAFGGNVIAHNVFSNLAAPSTWGRGMALSRGFYAQVTENEFNNVRIGVQ